MSGMSMKEMLINVRRAAATAFLFNQSSPDL
jgi:hypothetical protein